MTTTRTYRCNLCGDSVDDETGCGVLFASAHKLMDSGLGRGTTMEQKRCRDAENHMCRACIKCLRDFDLETAPPPDGPHAVVFKRPER